MTWNIWHGGIHGTPESNFEEDTTNTLNIIKVLELENPDVLLMQETYCCGMQIAKEAGYKYSWRGSSNLSIHSKFPIIDTIHLFRPFNSHGAIIDIHGQHYLFINLWLHYLPNYFQNIKTQSPDSLIMGEDSTRFTEIKSIVREIGRINENLNLPIIVGGDFNSGSHLDWIESTKEHHYGKVVEWPVSKHMHDRAYHDSFRKIHADPINSLQGTWGFLNQDIISDRIDYIYYKGKNLKPVASKIVMDDPPGGFFNSDHRAVMTAFNMINRNPTNN